MALPTGPALPPARAGLVCFRRKQISLCNCIYLALAPPWINWIRKEWSTQSRAKNGRADNFFGRYGRETSKENPLRSGISFTCGWQRAVRRETEGDVRRGPQAA